LRNDALSYYTFRYDRDLKGRGKSYLNVFPSKKAVQQERDKLRKLTNSHQCFKAIPELIRRTEPAPERLGQLLLCWIRDGCAPGDRLLRAWTSHPASAKAKSETIPSARRSTVVSVLPKPGLVNLARLADAGAVKA
jgi:hypothetical protein